MRATVSERVQVKAAGGVRTLDTLLEVLSIGVTRVGATATATILDDYRARTASSSGPPTGGVSSHARRAVPAAEVVELARGRRRA